MKPLTPLIFPLLLCCLLLGSLPLRAQTASIDSLLTRAFETDVLLPKLVDSAILFSAELRRVDGSEAYAKANLSINKNGIYNALSMVSSYNYGTNISAINNQAAASPTNNFTTAQTSFYNVGVGLQLPLTHLINRRHIIKSGQSLVNMAVAERKAIELIIKQEVIKLYQQFKLAHRLMMISGKNKQTSQLNNTMAEKNFLNGQLNVEQVAGVLSIYNRSIIEFESYVNGFQTSYLQLEAYTGTNLSSLIRQLQ